MRGPGLSRPLDLSSFLRWLTYVAGRSEPLEPASPMDEIFPDHLARLDLAEQFDRLLGCDGVSTSEIHRARRARDFYWHYLWVVGRERDAEAP
ncbi:MAG: hypothetical protein ACYCU7_11660 [Acidimicrobiales bacterium]